MSSSKLTLWGYFWKSCERRHIPLPPFDDGITDQVRLGSRWVCGMSMQRVLHGRAEGGCVGGHEPREAWGAAGSQPKRGWAPRLPHLQLSLTSRAPGPRPPSCPYIIHGRGHFFSFGSVRIRRLWGVDALFRLPQGFPCPPPSHCLSREVIPPAHLTLGVSPTLSSFQRLFKRSKYSSFLKSISGASY